MRLRRASRRWPLFIGYPILTVFIGYLDFITGLTPDFTVIYLIPIVLGTLQLSLRFALGLSFLAFLVHLGGALAVEGDVASLSAYVDGIFHLAVFVASAYVSHRVIESYREIETLRDDLQRDFEIAKATQRAIFPLEPPRLKGLDTGAKLVFARAVGGDFYDLAPVGESKIGLLVADISGKSLSAALFTALLRENWRNAITDHVEPLAIVKELNRRLYRELPSSMFLTVFCGVIDGEANELRFVNAGHEPGILRRADSKTMFLSSPEPMILGIGQDQGGLEQAVDFGEGSLLLLYTDGLTDPPAAGFGEREILGLLDRHSAEPAQSVAEAVYNARFGAQSPPKDDVLVLCVKK
jgi:phosphoserine phosphatase RsbU/P